MHASTLCFVSTVPVFNLSTVPVFNLSASVTEGVDSREMKSPDEVDDDRTDCEETAAAADAGDDAG